MRGDEVFQPLAPEKIKELVGNLRIGYDLLSVTLCNGDILLGGIEKHWEWDGKIITLGFNTQEGKRFGHSFIVEVPLCSVADIQLIPLEEESIPRIADNDPQLAFLKELGLISLVGQTEEEITRLPIQDYPNPLAKIICDHNIKIIDQQKLLMYGYVEQALSQDAIPPDGICLSEEFLLYADWDFFTHLRSGAISVGGGMSVFIAYIEIAKDISPSLQSVVMGKLKNDMSERIKSRIIPQIGHDELIQGFLRIPDPQIDTEIEGEKCIVILCTTTTEKGDKQAHPVLIKKRQLKFPFEFLGRLNSRLTFFGENLPLPLNIMGMSYGSIMLARAIAYLTIQEK